MRITKPIFSILATVVTLSIYTEGHITIFVPGPIKIIQDCPKVPLSPTAVQVPPINSKKSFVTTPKRTAGPVGCPDSEGYYQAPSSQQCFRYYGGSSRWQEAKDRCASEGMVMAKPEERSVKELNQYLWDTYSYFARGVWLGARGSGLAIVWEGTNTAVSSSWWADGHPGRYKSDDYCLLMYVGYSQPSYSSERCAGTMGTLCEVINE